MIFDVSLPLLRQQIKRLIFRGKQISEDNTLFEADMDLNFVIQLWEVKAPLPPPPLSR